VGGKKDYMLYLEANKKQSHDHVLYEGRLLELLPSIRI